MNLKNAKLVIILLLALAIIFDLLGAIVFAVVLFFLTKPIFEGVNKVIKQRAFTAFIISVIILLLIVFPILLAVQSLVMNLSAVVNLISSISIKITVLTKGIGSGVLKGFVNVFMQKVISALGGLLLTVPKRVVDLFIIVSLLYYFLKDGPKIKNYVFALVKDNKEKNILIEIENLLSGIILGSILAAIVIGLISYGIFLILGLKFAAAIAFIVGLAALIPIIGTWIVYIPLVIFYILTGNYIFAFLIALAGIFMQILEIYLAPKLSSDITKIHPAILLLGFIGGPLFFGVKGIILGPLILGAAKIILDNYKK